MPQSFKSLTVAIEHCKGLGLGFQMTITESQTNITCFAMSFWKLNNTCKGLGLGFKMTTTESQFHKQTSHAMQCPFVKWTHNTNVGMS